MVRRPSVKLPENAQAALSIHRGALASGIPSEERYIARPRQPLARRLTRPRCHVASSARADEILNRHFVDVRRLEAEDLTVEGELGFEGTLDVLGSAEAVLLALVEQASHRQLLLPHRRDHHLRLVRRNDFVFQSLEEDDRTGEALGMIERRALQVQVAPLWIWTDHRVEITRLELVRIGGERFEVAHTVVAGAGLE